MTDDTTFMGNLRQMHKFLSTWVVFAITSFAAWWLQVPHADQAAMLAANPWMKWAAPLAAFGAFCIARGLPQFADSPTFAEAMKKLPTYASTWVAFLMSAGAAYWLQMDPTAQQSVLSAVPGATVGGPLGSFVLFAVARGLPQSTPE
jgi:hypothetical protein